MRAGKKSDPAGRPAAGRRVVGGSGVAGVRQGRVRERVRERLVVREHAVGAEAEQLEARVRRVGAETHREQAVRRAGSPAGIRPSIGRPAMAAIWISVTSSPRRRPFG